MEESSASAIGVSVEVVSSLEGVVVEWRAERACRRVMMEGAKARDVLVSSIVLAPAKKNAILASPMLVSSV